MGTVKVDHTLSPNNIQSLLSLQHVMMKVSLFFIVFALYSIGPTRAWFVVPEELPTLLSFLYTNIPPIFKGTDSRLGVGFRVGPNADFQMQFELGPQTRTKALGPDAENEEDGLTKKRQVANEIIKQLPVVEGGMKELPHTPIGWLKTWKTSVSGLHQEPEVQDLSGSQPEVAFSTVEHLQQLYKEQPMEKSVER